MRIVLSACLRKNIRRVSDTIRGTPRRVPTYRRTIPGSIVSNRILDAGTPGPDVAGSSFYPVSDVGETPARVANREVFHPTTQNRIDFLDHPAHRLGTRDPEDLFELAQQGRPVLAFRQSQRHPSSPATPDTTELKTEKSGLLPL